MIQSGGRNVDAMIHHKTRRGIEMNTFIIRRKSNWANAQELEASARLSARVGNEEMADRVRWIRSYVVKEDDGRLGTVCVYQGNDEQAVREHADRARMTADEVIPVEDTVIVREDPIAEPA
jgi:hypothetical protein